MPSGFLIGRVFLTRTGLHFAGKRSSIGFPGRLAGPEREGARTRDDAHHQTGRRDDCAGAIAVSAVGWLNYRNLEQALLPRVVDRIESQSRLAAADLESYVAGARGDVAGFRAPASRSTA